MCIVHTMFTHPLFVFTVESKMAAVASPDSIWRGGRGISTTANWFMNNKLKK